MSSSRTNVPRINVMEAPSWYKSPWKPKYQPGNFIWCPRCGEYKNKFMKQCDICNEWCIQFEYSGFGPRGFSSSELGIKN